MSCSSLPWGRGWDFLRRFGGSAEFEQRLCEGEMGAPDELGILEAFVPGYGLSRLVQRFSSFADRERRPAPRDLHADRRPRMERDVPVVLDRFAEPPGQAVHPIPDLVVDGVPGDDRVPLLDGFPVALLEELELAGRAQVPQRDERESPDALE